MLLYESQDQLGSSFMGEEREEVVEKERRDNSPRCSIGSSSRDRLTRVHSL